MQVNLALSRQRYQKDTEQHAQHFIQLHMDGCAKTSSVCQPSHTSVSCFLLDPVDHWPAEQVVHSALDGDVKRHIKPTLVSVTKVELTRDLGVAKISVAITGRQTGQEQAMNTLLGLRGCVVMLYSLSYSSYLLPCTLSCRPHSACPRFSQSQN